MGREGRAYYSIHHHMIFRRCYRTRLLQKKRKGKQSLHRWNYRAFSPSHLSSPISSPVFSFPFVFRGDLYSIYFICLLCHDVLLLFLKSQPASEGCRVACLAATPTPTPPKPQGAKCAPSFWVLAPKQGIWKTTSTPTPIIQSPMPMPVPKRRQDDLRASPHAILCNPVIKMQ
jgi:hypothetical protein